MSGSMLVLGWFGLLPAQAAEITEVLDGWGADKPLAMHVDVQFRSTNQRALISHEWKELWALREDGSQPLYRELRFEQQTYWMDVDLRAGLYRGLELALQLPWVIEETRTIQWSRGVSSANSVLYNQAFDGVENSLGDDPGTRPSTARAGFGDMSIELRWAAFTQQREEAFGDLVLGLAYTLPTGTLTHPSSLAASADAGVGLGHHVLTPFVQLSRTTGRFAPYVELRASFPFQGDQAREEGLVLPTSAGMTVGLETALWQEERYTQRLRFDVNLFGQYLGAVSGNGTRATQGTQNEVSDFLKANPDQPQGKVRQFQTTGDHGKMGVGLAFLYQLTPYARFRLGASFAYDSDHWLTGAPECQDRDGNRSCADAGDQRNYYQHPLYDESGRRVRLEESLEISWFVSAVAMF